MTGTKAGGAKAAKTNKLRHGENFYSRIGAKGGKVSTPTGGFGSDKKGPDGLTGRQRAKLAGAIGGSRSTRAGVKNGEGKTPRRKKTEKTAKTTKKTGLLKKIFGGK